MTRTESLCFSISLLLTLSFCSSLTLSIAASLSVYLSLFFSLSPVHIAPVAVSTGGGDGDDDYEQEEEKPAEDTHHAHLLLVVQTLKPKLKDHAYKEGFPKVVPEFVGMGPKRGA